MHLPKNTWVSPENICSVPPWPESPYNISRQTIDTDNAVVSALHCLACLYYRSRRKVNIVLFTGNEYCYIPTLLVVLELEASSIPLHDIIKMKEMLIIVWSVQIVISFWTNNGL